jgi:HK97 family phage portal protein
VRIFGRNLSLPGFGRHRAATLTDREFWDEIFGYLKTASGIDVTPIKAMGVSTVFACVHAISRSFSTLPLKLYRRLPTGGQVEAQDHPLYSLLHDAPSGEMTSADFRGAVQANATLRQAGYALIVRDGLERIVELRPIANSDIRQDRDAAGTLGYWLRENGAEVWCQARSILSIRGLTFNGITGADIITTARECIGLAIALQDNAAKFFGNGSRPGAILSHPKTLSKEAIARLKESVDAQVTGKKAFSTLVLEEGLVYAAQRADNDKSQMLESRVQQDKAICQIFGIPPHKVGILENATFSNIEEQSIEYVGDTILPWAVRWEQSLNQKLLTPEERRAGYFFGFVLDGLLRGDIATRYMAYALGRQWGWLCVDEIRGKENMNPLPDGKGQIYLQPLNMGEPGSEKQQEDLAAKAAAIIARRKQTKDAAA